jgi:hypothetical protein
MDKESEMSKCLLRGLELIRPDFKHIVECGVYKGKTLRLIKKALDDSYSLFGFDSFVGLPEDWTGAKTKERINGVKTGRKIDVKKGHFNLDGQIPEIEDVTFYAGWFENTIPDYLKTHNEPIALLHIDCDLYSSTRDALSLLNDRIVRNTMLVFDDWTYNSNAKCNDGEQKAFIEWAYFFKRKVSFPKFPDSDSSKCQQKLVKIIR